MREIAVADGRLAFEIVDLTPPWLSEVVAITSCANAAGHSLPALFI